MSNPRPDVRPVHPPRRVGRPHLFAGLALAVTTALLVAPAALPSAEAATRPAAITAVSSKPGPKPGEVRIAWSTSGSHTTAYRIDTSLSLFSRTDKNLPRQGRGFTSFVVNGGSRRSVTLSAAATARAGAPVGSANHLYFRIYALNGSTERAYARLQSVSVQPQGVPASGSAIRVASFNVRTANAAGDTGSRKWSARAPYVARAIVAKNPGLVAIQELSPGSITGTTGGTRQTTSLLNALRSNGGGKYALNRTTSYAKPGTPMGSQGARILYDTTRYQLRTACREMTGSSHWNVACTIRMPLRPGDSEKERRLAAVARFRDRKTGKEFYFVSVHLDARKSTNATTQRSYESLRGAQVKAVTARLAAINAHRATPLPVVFAGDINSWQNTPSTYAPHNELVKAGFYDTAAATSRINFRYSTVTAFATTFKPTSSGFGARLDVIAVKGVRGSARFETVLKVTDSHRPSDHNMVLADFKLPR